MKRLIAMVLSLAALFSFCAFAQAEDYVPTAAAPSGAPALALAMMASENPDAYRFVAADTIAAEFASAQADFIIAPINAGAKLFKAGKSAYQLAAVVTWGNLYFASQKADFSLETLNGASVVFFGEDTINASIARYALEKSGVVPAEITYLAGAAQTQSLLLSDAEAIVLTAEPALTAASIKNDQVKSFALNDLLKQALDMDGYAQAGLFVNPETAKAHPEAVAAFLEAAKASAGKCADDVEAVANAAVALEILPNVKVALSAIPGCAIRFVNALEAREAIEATANIDLKQYGGAVPEDGFYFTAE
ncbi:MAG: ABC transporter substrate-binding protein [Clostridia bacterium]|nr:ABC transporter substrate-binding protein [Clostridia bacterium]